MMRIYLIRHGKTMANENWLYCGSTDLPLSENGLRELEEYKKTVRYPDISGCKVYTSGMLRTEQTLSVLYGEIPHKVDRRLREMDFGDFEMQDYEHLKEQPDYQAWITGDNMANICPNGESGNMMVKRALEALKDIVCAKENAAVFSHGGIIASVMDSLFPEQGRSRYQWQPKNGLGYCVEIDGPDKDFCEIKQE